MGEIRFASHHYLACGFLRFNWILAMASPNEDQWRLCGKFRDVNFFKQMIQAVDIFINRNGHHILGFGITDDFHVKAAQGKQPDNEVVFPAGHEEYAMSHHRNQLIVERKPPEPYMIHNPHNYLQVLHKVNARIIKALNVSVWEWISTAYQNTSIF